MSILEVPNVKKRVSEYKDFSWFSNIKGAQSVKLTLVFVCKMSLMSEIFIAFPI